MAKSNLLNIAAVVLAGGKSSRMGSNKATLKIGAKSMLAHMVAILSAAGIVETYINDKQHIVDEIIGKGPLSGIHASMKKLVGLHQFLIFTPVDMPALTPTLIDKLMMASQTFDLVKFDDHQLPFRLKINIKNIDLIQKILLESDDYSLLSFYRKLSILELKTSDISPKFFQNINTQNDWQLYIDNR